MKIIKSIEEYYEQQLPDVSSLETKVRELMLLKKKSSWHYTGRVKEKESFALKLETGRINDPRKFEDFFACTLVVENSSKFVEARGLIDDNFEVINQRPSADGSTHKSPDSFPFDDIRLYVKLRKPEYLEDAPMYNILFEVQLKTFLQHAWSIATHDLIYKSDELNWSKARVAYQVKAMLEQAESAISAVDIIAEVPELKRVSYQYDELIKIINFLNDNFDKVDLPSNVKLLAENVSALIKNLRISLDDLQQILTAENDARRGRNIKNLSPYAILLQSIINQKYILFKEYISSKYPARFKIMVPKEIDLKGLVIDKSNQKFVCL